MPDYVRFLPSYSPELNPDEYLNQDLKRHMRQVQPRPVDKPGLKSEIRRFLHRRQRQPQIIRNELHCTRGLVRGLIRAY
jgi:transposase